MIDLSTRLETTAPALGPGDADPRSPASAGGVPVGVLGPGDDDPRSPAAIVTLVGRPPLGPGEDDPRSPAIGRVETTAGAAGPGDSEDDGIETRIPAQPSATSTGE